jgi:hypothetical protein
MVQVLPNFIIAGVHKSGTTSLFYYLGDHPDVCASLDKETNFFIYTKYKTPVNPLDKYYEQFEKYKNEKIVMEASPGYFYGGKATAREIKDKCNNPKVLIILRNPTDRVISFFNRKKEVFQLPDTLTLSDYFDRCQKFSDADLIKEENHLYTGFEFGFYIKHIDEWFEVFGDNLKVMFFDDLKDSKKVVLELCDWLGIDKAFYNNYNFEVKNKSVDYKNRFMHSLAVRISFGARRFWRKNQKLKSFLRNAYYKLNGQSASKAALDANVKARINALYEQPNKQLAEYLGKKGFKNLPGWLQP